MVRRRDRTRQGNGTRSPLRVFGAALALGALVCAPASFAQASPEASHTAIACPYAPASGRQVPTPLDLFGPLFVAVQEARLYPDSKTFADAEPRRAPDAIMADYCAQPPRGAEALRAFVERNFTVPAQPATLAPARRRVPLARHIALLWSELAREPAEPAPGSSAISLERAYVVPGGRFREMYYWDSYFTMLGLRVDGRDDLVEAMIDDFTALIERFGHVPNGTRSYYVTRSQPPFYYLMVGLSTSQDAALRQRRLAAMKREHAFWTSGEHQVRMPDGSLLSRYASPVARPREESWGEDAALRAETGRAPDELYPDIRAAAESGWDFSSRWFADGRTMATIDTMDVVPVDLNALLFGLEQAIASACREAGERACVDRFADLAAARRVAVERWLWDEAEARYGDYDLDAHSIRPGLTAASVYPLFTGLAAPARSHRVLETVESRLLAQGGLRTSLVDTGQQWDAPNGWAPLQWIAVDAARRGGRPDLARAIATRFLATVAREYCASGKLLEKYNVEQQVAGGGGEYPTQDGFGWTNGVTRALQAAYPALADEGACQRN